MVCASDIVAISRVRGAVVDKDGMVSAGIFYLRDKVYIDAMPVHNASCFWQAWKMPDGLFMVQPLDQDKLPWGTVYLLEAQEFDVMLMPAPVAGAASGGKTKSGSSTEPDLLAIWYEQAVVDQGANSKGSSFESASPEVAGGVSDAQRLAAARPKKRAGSDDPVLLPVWDPDELFSREDDVPLHVKDAYARSGTKAGARQTAGIHGAAGPGNARASARPDVIDDEDDLLSEVYAQTSPPRNTLDSMPALSLEKNGSPSPRRGAQAAQPIMTDVSEAKNDDAQAEAQQLEQRMRREFDALMEKFDKSPGPAVERELTQLVLRNADFTWKQKFMYSEFGFALRRKRLHKLALASHMRALGYAPKDEHILFNVARSEYELGKVDAARIYLNKAIEAAPTFNAARTFLAFLEGQGESRT
jgi:hypothetical protein